MSHFGKSGHRRFSSSGNKPDLRHVSAHHRVPPPRPPRPTTPITNATPNVLSPESGQSSAGSRGSHRQSLSNPIGKSKMTETLVYHLFFDRILPVLPVESTLTTYREVESDQFFISCRGVIMNVALSRDLNPVIDYSLQLIESLTESRELISDEINEDVAQSVLVLLRLLSDTLEFCWESKESPEDKVKDEPSFENIPIDDNKEYVNMGEQARAGNMFTGSTIGYSTHKPGFHRVPPPQIDSTLATRLLSVCTRLKYNTRTLRVLKNMSKNLYGNGTITYSSVLPKFQAWLKYHNYPKYTETVDLTIDYILRFIAAANPADYDKYVDSKVTNPLLISHTLTELGIVKYLDFFGCVFLTPENVGPFLETLRHLSGFMKRTIFHSLLLYYSSKAFLFWILSRPNEYVQLYYALQNLDSSKSNTFHQGNSNSSIATIPYCVSVLFDDIYSTFNVSSLLTNIYDTRGHNGSTTQPVETEQSQATSPGSTNPVLFSPTLTSNDGIITSPTMGSNQIASPLSPLPMSLDFNSRTQAQGFPLEETASIHSSKRSYNIDESVYSTMGSTHSNINTPTTNASFTHPNEDEIPTSGSGHLQYVLELFSNYEETELSSHTSILRFLLSLILLDTDVFTDINAMTFRYIPDTSKIIQQYSQKQGTRDAGAGTHMQNDDPSKEKEKNQSIKQITHGLKKLTNLSSSKKKTVKFITMLIRNLNGAQMVSDVSLVDSLKTLVALVTLTSSISLIDSNLPSVLFAKRIFSILGHNLDVGKNWESKTNGFIASCTERNPISHRRLQLEFFAAAIQLDSDKLLSHIHLERELAGLNLRRLLLYTEGFKVFFNLLSSDVLRKKVALSSSNFLKSLFCIIADILLKAFPYFDAKVTSIVSSILDGSILEKYDTIKTLAGLEPSNPPVLDRTDSSVKLKLQKKITNWDVHEVLPTLSAVSSSSDINLSDTGKSIAESTERRSNTSTPAHTSTPANLTHNPLSTIASPPSTPGSIGNYRNNPGMNVLSPHARRLQNVKIDSPQVEGERTRQSPYYFGATSTGEYSNQSVSHSSLPKTTRSSGSQEKSRRSSDDKNKPQLKMQDSDDVIVLKTNENDDARRIMINIFSIFKKMTNYFILPHDQNLNTIWVSKDFRNIMKPIFVAIIDTDTRLQTTAQSFMDVLIRYISKFSSDITARSLNEHYLLCNYTITLFAASLFDLKLDNKKREIILRIVVKFLNVKSDLSRIAAQKDLQYALYSTELVTFPLLTATVGGGLFISLYCNKGEIPRLLKKGFGEFLFAINCYEKHVGEIDRTCIYNLGFIVAMSRDNYAASGSVAFQRRLRNKILHHIKRPDTILLDAMDVIYRKWSSYMRKENITQEELIDFRSLAGILASMSGILLSFGETSTDNVPHLFEFRGDLIKKMDYFVFKQCQWLNNPDLLTRENSRDILSMELHPLSFNILFDNLRIKIEELRSVNLSQKVHESSFVLLEQIITIVRTVLNRDDDERIMLLFSIRVVSTIDQLSDLVEKIPHSSVKYYKAIIQMAKLFRAIQHSEISLGIKNHFYLKNKWLKLLTNWFKVTISIDYDFDNLSKPLREMDLKKRDLDFLYIDTAIETSKAVAYLTENVPLDIPPSASKDELERASTIVFGNYFTIFLKGLEKSTDIQRFPVSLKHKITILNENVILSLTNLSNANVDASLQFKLPMGYSKDKNIRIAFLKVFINIVTNYPKLKVESERKKLYAVDQLVQYLIEHPHLAFQAGIICPASDVDAFVAGLVNGFDSRNASHILVTQLIKDEIDRASRYADVLRRNSCATRALSLYARSKGQSYLVRTLKPVLDEFFESRDSFEIEKILPDDPEAEKNVDMFIHYMSKLINAITESVDYFPPELINICQTIFHSVKEKFPDYSFIAVGSFVFLRFLGPAIVSPDAENIILISQTRDKRPLITLAKVLQNMANGSENLTRWPILNKKLDIFKDFSNRIFEFLSKICTIDSKPNIEIRRDPEPYYFEFNFLHKFLYEHELEIRKMIVESLVSLDDFDYVRKTFLFVDDIMGVLGRPKVELKNEIPPYIVEHMEENPHLYEFMNRNAFKNVSLGDEYEPFMHESMSLDGLPIITITFRKFEAENIEVDAIVYRTIQVYSKMWMTKHYLVLDCTGSDSIDMNYNKLTSLFFSLLPDIAIENCIGAIYFNVSENFMNQWVNVLRGDNPYLVAQVPHHFINSSSDQEQVKTLGLTGKGADVVQDTRVSLHDISLYHEDTKNLENVSLKIGNRYIQILHEATKQYKLHALNQILNIPFNDVYEIVDLATVGVSSITGLPNEFTINFINGKRLVLVSKKYLEIVKMFNYAQLKIEDEYGTESQNRELTSTHEESYVKESQEIICHLSLVILNGLFNDDNEVKNISYNLLVVTQNAFNLNFGSRFQKAPEVYVPDNTTTFLSTIARALAESSPELTLHMWTYFLEGLENDVIPHEHIPTIICCLSYWVPNLYRYVYLVDEEEGANNLSKIIRSLIQLTVKDPDFTTVYLQQIWFLLVLDDRLTSVTVEEFVTHALDRDSESRDWKKAVSLLTAFPTVEVACQVIGKLMDIIKSFLPSLKMEVSTHSWSELEILVRISVSLFFESPLLTQMCLPEVLFIISLLIDIGPTHIRYCLHELLMNICHSLMINSSLPKENSERLDGICAVFARQKLNFMSGFSQEKGRILPNFSASSFSSKFGTLDHFVTNVFKLMEYGSTSEAAQWKTKYKKYLLGCVFNHESFLSARAIMILGIIGKIDTNEILCRDLLAETMKIFAEPVVTDEQLFVGISHIFTYSKIVAGLDPAGQMLPRMFWLATVFVESPHPILFEGGLQFLINCLKHLYEYHYKINNTEKLISELLIESRSFASELLEELEGYTDCLWTKDNFEHLILGFITRGLSLAVLRGVALDCLMTAFKYSFREHQMIPRTSHHLNYLFLLYLVSNQETFLNLLDSVGFESDYIELDDNIKIPRALVEWISSDNECSNITLYQGALLFASPASDEPSKLRFELLTRYLLGISPKCVFRYYFVTRQELRRISSLEQQSDSSTIAFEIAGMLVMHDDFDILDIYNKDSVQLLKSRGLFSLTKVNIFGRSFEDIMNSLQENSDQIYNRKRLTTLIISKIIYQSQLTL